MVICLAKLYDSATTMRAKEFIAYFMVTVSAADILAADVFVAGIFY